MSSDKTALPPAVSAVAAPTAGGSSESQPGRHRRRRGRRPGRQLRNASSPAKAAPATSQPNGAPSQTRRKPLRPIRLRRGVGLVVINAQGQVLAGLRAHSRGEAAWQLPQGGIEGREKPLTAAYRELQEETGLVSADVELIHEMPHWTRYYLPKEWQGGKRFAGQTQRWYLLRYRGEGIPPISRALHKEFTELNWVDVNWLVSHVIAFRQSVYRQVFRHFAPYLTPNAIEDQ